MIEFIEKCFLDISKTYFEKRTTSSFLGLYTKTIYICKKPFSYVENLMIKQCNIDQIMKEKDMIKAVMTIHFVKSLAFLHHTYNSTYNTRLTIPMFTRQVITNISNKYGMDYANDLHLSTNLEWSNSNRTDDTVSSVSSTAYPSSISRPMYSKNLPDNFTCTICLEPFLNPVTASSGRTYCKECITRWLENNDTDPVDRSNKITKTLIPNLVAWTMMNEYKIESQ